VHLLYRRDTLPVQQPHSVPLQFLSETGIVGAALGIGALLLLLGAAGRSVRRRPPGSERLLAAALLTGAVAYGIHSLYDWDWNIPGVTLPALVFIGVVVGARGASDRPPSPDTPAPATRGLRLGALTLWLCVFALSAVLPSLAASKANSALIQAASGSSSALRSAQASAALASSLDPLSDAGLRAEATIAIHRGLLGRARADLQAAVGRDPTDVLAWNQLALVYALLRDTSGATLAAQRVIALDPRGQTAQTLLRSELLAAPPGESAAASQTPLPGK
jgi:tetratricopeptide (TPR) repeat protein